MKKVKSYLIVASIIATIIIVPTVISYLHNRQKAVIILNKPNSYQIGELVTLDASASKADDLIWRILPETDNFIAMGKTALFSSTEPIDYTLVIVARKEKNIDCKIFTLKYSKTKVVNKSTLTYFEQMVAVWIADANLIKNKVEGQKLAQSFKIVGHTIESGVYDSVDGIVNATAYANSNALNGNLDAWKPFLINFQEYLEANPPASIKDHALIWNNMSIALVKAYE